MFKNPFKKKKTIVDIFNYQASSSNAIDLYINAQPTPSITADFTETYKHGLLIDSSKDYVKFF